MPSLTETRHPATPTPPRRRTRRKSALARAAASRRLDESPGTTHASGSGASSSADGDAPSAAAAAAAAEVSVPAGECEACPRDWRVANERDDERIPGEYASCEKHGRRRQFEHAVLFQGEEQPARRGTRREETRTSRVAPVIAQTRLPLTRRLRQNTASSHSQKPILPKRSRGTFLSTGRAVTRRQMKYFAW